MTTLTTAESDCLAWFVKRGGSGVWTNGKRVVLVRGETAPFMRQTWYNLIDKGYVNPDGNRLYMSNKGSGLK